MAKGYWESITASRVTRRRALIGAAGLGAGAAALSLIGCGGGDGGGEEGRGAGTRGQDTTGQAVPGGQYVTSTSQDPVNWDPNLSTSFTVQAASGGYYSRLLKFDTGPGLVPLGKVRGDAAEKFEVSGDAQTWTFTLRQGMKFHQKGPASVSGRDLDSEDVAASYKYFLEKNGNRAILVNLVDKMETPDKNTVVIKLKEPYAPFQELMASSSLFWIMSKQGATGELDTQKVEGVVGTGPWILQSATPSVDIVYRRHANWYEKRKISTGEYSLPLMDGGKYLIISEYAQVQAQFLANNLDAFAVRNADLADVVRQKPEATQELNNPGWLLSFFYFNLNNASNAFKDERLRRALSMSLDRDGIIETFGEIAKLKAQGLTINTGWNNSPVPWGDGGLFWWLDPKSSAQGSSGQWYKYDVAEAKKLLAAANYTGQSFDLNTTSQIYGSTFDLQTEAQIPMLTSVGFKPEVKITDYRSHYFPEVYTKGNYSHVAYGYNTPFATIDEYMFRTLTPGADQNHSFIDDSEVTDLVKKQRLEVDANKRQALIYEIQRKVSDKMYYVPSVVGRWGSVTLFNPRIQNVGVFRTGSYGVHVETWPYYWIKQG
jgi:peptide/nickel transport system substrate-binding protein